MEIFVFLISSQEPANIQILKMKSYKSLEKIIDLISSDPNFEHIGHIIHYLDRFDKKRIPEDPELKNSVFAVVKEILEREIATPLFGYSPIGPMPVPLPKTIDEILDYLEKYWGKPDDLDNDIGRAYLIFFQKRKK